MATTPGPATKLHAASVTATTVTLAWAAPTQLVLTPGDGKSFLDNSGARWALPASGQVTRNGVGLPNGSGTDALTYDSPTNTVWGRDHNNQMWYTWAAPDLWTPHSTISPVHTLTGVTYQVQYRVHGTTAWNKTATTQSTSLTVSGLQPRTEYDMEVLSTDGN